MLQYRGWFLGPRVFVQKFCMFPNACNLILYFTTFFYCSTAVLYILIYPDISTTDSEFTMACRNPYLRFHVTMIFRISKYNDISNPDFDFTLAFEIRMWNIEYYDASYVLYFLWI